mmetsp:Transcript_20640/g.52287  ORF Transcript_20640/g.52287 Transcript_20640/m.52287 type:complete len:369 (-) Transcript_20640:211-1317(-)
MNPLVPPPVRRTQACAGIGIRMYMHMHMHKYPDRGLKRAAYLSLKPRRHQHGATQRAYQEPRRAPPTTSCAPRLSSILLGPQLGDACAQRAFLAEPHVDGILQVFVAGIVCLSERHFVLLCRSRVALQRLLEQGQELASGWKSGPFPDRFELPVQLATQGGDRPQRNAHRLVGVVPDAETILAQKRGVRERAVADEQLLPFIDVVLRRDDERGRLLIVPVVAKPARRPSGDRCRTSVLWKAVVEHVYERRDAEWEVVVHICDCAREHQRPSPSKVGPTHVVPEMRAHHFAVDAADELALARDFHHQRRRLQLGDSVVVPEQRDLQRSGDHVDVVPRVARLVLGHLLQQEEQERHGPDQHGARLRAGPD